jgi:hypothetical protein
MGDQASGLIIFVLIASAVLTLPTAAVLLWLYRRSVRRGMTTGATHPESPPPSASAATPYPPMRIIDCAADPPAYAERPLRAAVTIYAAAGLAFALLFAIGWGMQSEGPAWTWLHLLAFALTLAVAYFWPAVLAIELVAATSRRQRLSIALGYFIAFASIGAGSLAVNSKLTAGQLATLWLLDNALPTLLIVMFLQRPIRAVGPLILTFMLIAVFGTWLALSLLGTKPGWDSDAVFYLLIIAGFVVFGLAGWLLLRRVGVLYRRKKFSDQSLMLDSLFLYFAITQAVLLDPSIGRVVWFGPAAFLAYKLIAWSGFRYLRRRASAHPAPMLLLLRVFALGGRSERLFDAFAKRWRRLGSISMIAGPDLVTAATEPHEFLDFVGGKLSRRFVSGEADLSTRIASLDIAPDPDGRYRVNQFFCRPDTWRITMRRLVREASVVLMDLRSFSSRNQGCVFELREILCSIDLRRVVFLIDLTTDRPFLESTLQSIWRQVPGDSPNHAAAGATVRLFPVQDGGALQVQSLLRELLAAADVSPAMASAARSA